MVSDIKTTGPTRRAAFGLRVTLKTHAIMANIYLVCFVGMERDLKQTAAAMLSGRERRLYKLISRTLPVSM